MSPKARFVTIAPVCGATSKEPSRTTHFAGVPFSDCHSARLLPSNSTIASDGGATAGRSGPASTTGGRGRSIEGTGHCWAGTVVGGGSGEGRGGEEGRSRGAPDH